MLLAFGHQIGALGTVRSWHATEEVKPDGVPGLARVWVRVPRDCPRAAWCMAGDVGGGVHVFDDALRVVGLENIVERLDNIREGVA